MVKTYSPSVPAKYAGDAHVGPSESSPSTRSGPPGETAQLILIHHRKDAVFALPERERRLPRHIRKEHQAAGSEIRVGGVIAFDGIRRKVIDDVREIQAIFTAESPKFA